jgi:lysophospholipase L1-like esterase
MKVVLLAAVVFASAAAASGPAYQPPQRYYLALGDSIAYGFQPTKPDTAPPSAFRTGYVDVFAAKLRKLAPGITVVNYGCPGESAVTFAKGGCDWLRHGGKLHDAFHGAQLDAAVAFLKAHPRQVSPITITLWGNDVIPLSQQGKKAPVVIAAFASRFASILKRLRAAAPSSEIIVTGAWNPEADKTPQADAAYVSLDRAIAAAAAGSRARVAKMFPSFKGKARLCKLTFFCTKGDPHPTDAGYRAMAAAFLAASGYPRK